MQLTAICGSLRAGSHNRMLLDNAATLLPDSVNFSIADWSNIPSYNEDSDTDNTPESVQQFKQAIDAADALLIATPEYNYGVPGGLKNALDWASRPAFKAVITGKPCAIISASMSAQGGCRAQAQLKQIMAGMLVPVYPAPEFLLASAHQAFDSNGGLTDENTRKRLQRFLDGYLDWLAG